MLPRRKSPFSKKNGFLAARKPDISKHLENLGAVGKSLYSKTFVPGEQKRRISKNRRK